MHSRGVVRTALSLVVALALVAGCGSKDEDPGSSGEGNGTTVASSPGGTDAAEIPDSATGVSDTEVRVGIHAPETLGGIDIGDLLGIGDITQLYWDTINDAGGINGRKVVVELADDGYEANAALQACRDLSEKDVLFISGTSGADQIVTCAKHAVDERMPYLSLGVSEAGLVGSPGYRAMTMTYDQMSALMAEYIVAEVADADTPVAMVRFNSPNSQGAQSAFSAAMGDLDANLVATDAVDKQGNANELTAECVKLDRADVEVVFMILAPTVSTQFARACTAQGFTPTYTTVSNTLSCATEPPIGVPELAGCKAFSAVRTPEAAEGHLVAEATQAWKARFPDREPPDQLSTFWAVFDVYREALDAAGRRLTRASFLKALDELDYDNGLLNPISFNGSQIASKRVVITEAIAKAPWQRELVGKWTAGF